MASMIGLRIICAGTGGEHDAFLAVVFPLDTVHVMAYNRVVADLRGRVGARIASAVMDVTDAGLKVVELAPGVTPEALARDQALRDGYVPMRTYGWHKVMQGLTTIEEVISVTSSDIGGGED